MTIANESVSSVGVDLRMVERAQGLIPLLRENAEETERLGHLTSAVVDALADAQMFDLMTPIERGGPECSVRTTCEVLIELGRGDGSAAWVSAIHNALRFSAIFMPNKAQDLIFSGTGDRICGTFAPTLDVKRSGKFDHQAHDGGADDGYVISGRWPYASGSHDAHWAFVGMAIPDDEGRVADFGSALIPMDQLTIERTWTVTGLEGTGSDTLVGENVFVPKHLVRSQTRFAQGEYPPPYTGTLYRSAYMPALALPPVAPAVGMARSALELTIARCADRPVAFTNYKHGRDFPMAIAAVAEAAAKIDTAALHIARAADAIDLAAAAGRTLTQDEHAMFRMDGGWAARQCREAVALLMDVNSSSGFNTTNPVQRHWRDIEIMTRNGIISPPISQEIYGRQLLGSEQMASF